MSTSTAVAHPGEDEGRSGLDNLTLSRKEGWQRFVDTPDRSDPTN